MTNVVRDETCMWAGCKMQGFLKAVMTDPCAHEWIYCLHHRDHSMMLQDAMTDEAWWCHRGTTHNAGRIIGWERV
jgi:hypothetical protein